MITQPDRPKGRSRQPAPSHVKVLAESHGLKILQPQKLSDEGFKEEFHAAGIDVGVVVAYGLLLPSWLLDMPQHGFINVHPSLVPRHRGAAPVERTLFEGDIETAVSILRMGPGLDDGPILGQRRFAVLPDEDAGALRERCSRIGAEMILEVLEKISLGTPEETPQSEEGATYAQKILSSEASINWELPANRILWQIRALSPRPGAATTFRDKKMKIYKATVAEAGLGDTEPAATGEVQPGTVMEASADGIAVATGEGYIVIHELQLEGKSRIAAPDFIRGSRIVPGERVG